MKTYPQCTELIAKGMQYINPRTNRKCTIKSGSRMWVSSTELRQQSQGIAEITAMGKPMGSGILLSLDDVAKYFEVIA